MKIRRVGEGRSWVARAFRAFLVLALIGAIFGIVWSGSSIIALEYQIGELEARMQVVLKERKELDASLSELLSMREVEARGLALHFPDRQNVYYVMRESQGVQRASALTQNAFEEAR